jgi:hypothetical protein
MKKYQIMFNCLGVFSDLKKPLKSYPELKKFIEETIIPLEKMDTKLNEYVPNYHVRNTFLDTLFEVVRSLLPIKGYYRKSDYDCLKELEILNLLPSIYDRYESLRKTDSPLRNAVILGNMYNNAKAKFTYSKARGSKDIKEIMFDYLCKEFQIKKTINKKKAGEPGNF